MSLLNCRWTDIFMGKCPLNYDLPLQKCCHCLMMKFSPWIWVLPPILKQFEPSFLTECTLLDMETWKMRSKDLFVILVLLSATSLTLGVFFGDDCPNFATFFEASNTTTDCNGAVPISSFGLHGDKFCSNICPDVSFYLKQNLLHCFSINRILRGKFKLWKFLIILNRM